MRRLTATALAGAAMAAGLALAPGATAGAERISDASGDANGTDLRGEGAPGPSDTSTGPASVDAVDVLAAELAKGRVVLHLNSQATPLHRSFEVVLTTPHCANVRVVWTTRDDFTAIQGCRGLQRVWTGAAHLQGNDVVLPLPTSWPSWLPAGTPVSRISVQTHALLELGTSTAAVGAVYLAGDYATGAVSTTLR